VRPLGVVVGHVAAEYVFEVAAAEDQQPVETLRADGSDERSAMALACGARSGVSRCGSLTVENLIEGGAVLAVAVAD
jgi:hypothetical protein